MIRIRAEDGTLYPFDEAALGEAIARAARSAGVGVDPASLARDMASIVSVYLQGRAETPTAAEVKEMVSRVLVETGYADIAREFQRDGRFESRDLFPIRTILVHGATRDEVSPWDRSRICRALVHEAAVPRQTAEEVSEHVERTLVAMRLDRVTTAFIRELVNQELLRRGLRGLLERQKTLGVPISDLRDLLGRPSPPDPEALVRQIGETTLRQFALEEIFTAAVSDGHREGRIHIHGCGNPWKFFAGRLPWTALGEPLKGLDPAQERLGRFFEFLELQGEGQCPPLPPGPWRIVGAADRLDPAVPVPAVVLQVERGGSIPPAWLARALQRGGVEFSFEAASRFGTSPVAIVQCVSLNLVRVAAEGKDLQEGVEGAVALAVRAHLQKHAALAPCLENVRKWLGDARLRYSVAVQGLHEALVISRGVRPGDSAYGQGGMRLLAWVQGLLREAAVRHGLPMELDDVPDSETARRLGRITAGLFRREDLSCTDSFHTPIESPADAHRALGIEAPWCALVGGAGLRIPAGARPSFSPDDLRGLLARAAQDRRIRRVAVL